MYKVIALEHLKDPFKSTRKKDDTIEIKSTEDLNRHFIKKDIQIVSKPKKDAHQLSGK